MHRKVHIYTEEEGEGIEQNRTNSHPNLKGQTGVHNAPNSESAKLKARDASLNENHQSLPSSTYTCIFSKITSNLLDLCYKALSRTMNISPDVSDSINCVSLSDTEAEASTLSPIANAEASVEGTQVNARRLLSFLYSVADLEWLE